MAASAAAAAGGSTALSTQNYHRYSRSGRGSIAYEYYQREQQRQPSHQMEATPYGSQARFQFILMTLVATQWMTGAMVLLLGIVTIYINTRPVDDTKPAAVAQANDLLCVGYRFGFEYLAVICGILAIVGASLGVAWIQKPGIHWLFWAWFISSCSALAGTFAVMIGAAKYHWVDLKACRDEQRNHEMSMEMGIAMVACIYVLFCGITKLVLINFWRKSPNGCSCEPPKFSGAPNFDPNTSLNDL